MHTPYEVTHRNYTHDGEFVSTLSLPWMTEHDATTDANIVLNGYVATKKLQAVTACNIIVRGPNGRFVKWKN